ncbi:hypothetical protein [Cronobacter sakazakii]|uniref:hypothetical protein n=1 Tax=Cronobacter sakazakii TaxID=28141 RepID=UPI00358F6C2A
MNTISNVTRYRAGLDEDGIVCHREKEDGRWVKYEDYEQLEEELLALRKERERAEPVAWRWRWSDDAEGHWRYTEERRETRGSVTAVPLYTAPPAPVVPDGLKRAVEFYEQVKQENTPAETGAWKDAVNWVLDEACRTAMLNQAHPVAEIDTTPQQFESLAGKALVPAGWKLVPIELTKEMLKQIHPFAEATCLDCGNQVVAHCVDNVTASWNDMLAVAPEPCK